MTNWSMFSRISSIDVQLFGAVQRDGGDPVFLAIKNLFALAHFPVTLGG